MPLLWWGCGLLAARGADGTIEIKGDPEHPANLGRICSKGDALAETIDLDGRLLYPQINGDRATWNDALALVANKFCLLYTSPSPRDQRGSRMPSSA